MQILADKLYPSGEHTIFQAPSELPDGIYFSKLENKTIPCPPEPELYKIKIYYTLQLALMSEFPGGCLKKSGNNFQKQFNN